MRNVALFWRGCDEANKPFVKGGGGKGIAVFIVTGR